VPGFGPPVAAFVSYRPAGTKNDAIQTSSSTIARTVNAVGNLDFFAGGSVGGCCSDDCSAGVGGGSSERGVDRGSEAMQLSVASAARGCIIPSG
jgi:hypothetical protein